MKWVRICDSTMWLALWRDSRILIQKLNDRRIVNENIKIILNSFDHNSLQSVLNRSKCDHIFSISKFLIEFVNFIIRYKNCPKVAWVSRRDENSCFADVLQVQDFEPDFYNKIFLEFGSSLNHASLSSRLLLRHFCYFFVTFTCADANNT